MSASEARPTDVASLRSTPHQSIHRVMRP